MTGSAIIGGQVLENGRQMVYFEGNKYGSGDKRRFVERCLHAHGRMAEKYPTTAKMALLPEQLVKVGEYDPVRYVVNVDKPVELGVWLSLLLVHDGVPVEQTIYRNPLRVRDREHFEQIRAQIPRANNDAELFAEFYIPLADKRSQRLQWNGETFWVTTMLGDNEQEARTARPDFEAQIDAALKQQLLYYVFPDVAWGIGW